jgi:hypothetical protein
MTISDETYKRMKDIEARAAEVMAMFKCDRGEALVYLGTNESWKAVAIAERIERRARQNALAQKRANATWNAQADVED